MPRLPAKSTWANWIAIGIGTLYGVLARFVFGVDAFDGIAQVMTWGFIFFVPFAIGVITTIWAEDNNGCVTWAFLPWISMLLLIMTVMVFLWEGIICIVLWLPVCLPLSSFGGLVGLLLRNDEPSKNVKVVVFVALLPLAISFIEERFDDPLAIRTVENRIEIDASAAEIWAEIREVPAILESELPTTFSHAIGFPKPVEARLEGEGVGSVRHASFEGGVVFIERVTEWEENESLAFTIDASQVPSTTFDQHVAVGGRYFDVLDGRYEIRRVSDDRSELVLSSRQRLSTRFNPYTKLWTDYFMSDIQQSILEVIKARAERAVVAS